MSKILLAGLGLVLCLGVMDAGAVPAVFKNGVVVSNGLDVASGTLTVGGSPVLTAADPIAPGTVGTNELDSQVNALLLAPSGVQTNDAAWSNLVEGIEAAQETADDAYPATNPNGYVSETSATGFVTKAGASIPGELLQTRTDGSSWTSTIKHAVASANTIQTEIFHAKGGRAYIGAANSSLIKGGFVQLNWTNTSTYAIIVVNQQGHFQRIYAGAPYTLWDSGNHGPGSGLIADLLDGYNSTDFVLGSSLQAYLKQVYVTPAAPTDPGTNGTWMVTNNFFYLCVTNGFGSGTNWNRVLMSGW